MQNQINNNNLNGDVKENIITKLDELKNDLNILNSKHKEYLSNFEKGEVNLNSENSASIYEQYKDTFSSTFAKVDSKANEIADLINNLTKKFTEDNIVFKFINEFKEYLSSLSAMEICLIINITSSIFILTCIISIIIAISGNYLIDKFILDQRYPKLSKIIELRVKLQNYYIYINSIFIILAVLSLIFVNTITLINS